MNKYCPCGVCNSYERQQTFQFLIAFYCQMKKIIIERKEDSCDSKSEPMEE